MDVIELIRENLADEFVVNVERNLKRLMKCYENWKEAILSRSTP